MEWVNSEKQLGSQFSDLFSLNPLFPDARSDGEKSAAPHNTG